MGEGGGVRVVLFKLFFSSFFYLTIRSIYLTITFTITRGTVHLPNFTTKRFDWF